MKNLYVRKWFIDLFSQQNWWSFVRGYSLIAPLGGRVFPATPLTTQTGRPVVMELQTLCRAELTCPIIQGQAEMAVRGIKFHWSPNPLRPNYACARKPACLSKNLMLSLAFFFFSLAAFVPAIALKSRPHPTRCCRIAEAASTALNAMPTKSCFYHPFPYLEDLNCLSGAQRLSGVWPTGISNRLSSSMLFENPADMPLIDPWVLWQGASKTTLQLHHQSSGAHAASGIIYSSHIIMLMACFKVSVS